MPMIARMALFFALIFSLYSCKKYEEGVYLSLQSRAARIDNTWQVAEAANAAGCRIVDSFANYRFTFTRQGDVALEFPSFGGTETLIGTWELTDDNDRFRWVVSGDTLPFYYNGYETFDILRLTGNEFWLVDDANTELRLSPQ